jgi:hypothetical protein
LHPPLVGTDVVVVVEIVVVDEVVVDDVVLDEVLVEVVLVASRGPEWQWFLSP